MSKERLEALENGLAELKKAFKGLEDVVANQAYFYTTTGHRLDFIITRLHPGGAADGVLIDAGSSAGAWPMTDVPMGKREGSQYWEPKYTPMAVEKQLFGEAEANEQESGRAVASAARS